MDMIPATPLTSRHLAQPSLNLATQCMYEPTRYGTDLSLVPMTALCLLSSARPQLKKGPTLGDDWENRWKLSKWKISKGIAGEFVAPAGKWPSEEKEDTGIQTNEGSKFFGIDANFDSVGNDGKDLSIQHQAKHENHLVPTAPSESRWKQVGGPRHPRHLVSSWLLRRRCPPLLRRSARATAHLKQKPRLQGAKAATRRRRKASKGSGNGSHQATSSEEVCGDPETGSASSTTTIGGFMRDGFGERH